MVNGQRLLETIRQAIASQPAASSDAAPQSLTRLMRTVQLQLRPLEASVPKPAMPLPSAETVAAFVDGQATASEEEHVVQSCIHDVGILLQVVNAVQAESVVAAAVDSALHTRLLAMQRAAAPSKSVITEMVIRAELVDPSPTQSIATKTLPTRPTNLSRIMPRIAAGVLAVCLLVACGWLVLRSFGPDVNGNGGTNQVVENGLDNFQSTDRAMVRNRPEVQGGDQGSPPALESPTNEAAVDAQGTQLAVDQSNFGQENERPVSAEVEGPALREESVLKDDSAQAVPDRIATIPPKQSIGPDMRVQPVARLRWTQVVGILAEQKDLGYDHWKVISEERGQDPTSGDIRQEQRSWLTLPTCFAQGELTSGGRLVMNQDTHLDLVSDSQGQVKLDVQFGSIALIDVPAGKQLSIATSPASVSEFEFRAPSSIQIQRIIGGIQFTVAAGDVVQDGVQVPRNKRITCRQDVREIGPDSGLETWAIEVPKSSELPRQILANFADVENLEDAMDRQLANMARNLNPSNPLSVKNFRQLCKWRSRLSVEEPTAAMKHPLWFVRNSAFDSMLLSTDHMPMLNAKRDLLARLQGVSVMRIRAWVEMARGAQKPSRQDLAQWLGLIASDDSVAAAFGDYLLRKQYPNGPMFDPNADVGSRQEVQRAWRAQIAGG